MNSKDEVELADDYWAISTPDYNRGDGWCKFELNGKYIWAIKYGWQAAELIDNHYSNHAVFSNLEDAFKHCTPINTP